MHNIFCSLFVFSSTYSRDGCAYQGQSFSEHGGGHYDGTSSEPSAYGTSGYGSSQGYGSGYTSAGGYEGADYSYNAPPPDTRSGYGAQAPNSSGGYSATPDTYPSYNKPGNVLKI